MQLNSGRSQHKIIVNLTIWFFFCKKKVSITIWRCPVSPEVFNFFYMVRDLIFLTMVKIFVFRNGTLCKAVCLLWVCLVGTPGVKSLPRPTRSLPGACSECCMWCGLSKHSTISGQTMLTKSFSHSSLHVFPQTKNAFFCGSYGYLR